MLTEICDFIHNYFIRETFAGDFTINENGELDLSGKVISGQRFRIRGSALNDGIYTYFDGVVLNDDADQNVMLQHESFHGTIESMGIPASLIRLSHDISVWVETNSAILNSPYTSESFGGYSYTKATGSGANAGGALTWQDMFRSKLNAYRKLA